MYVGILSNMKLNNQPKTSLTRKVYPIFGGKCIFRMLFRKRSLYIFKIFVIKERIYFKLKYEAEFEVFKAF